MGKMWKNSRNLRNRKVNDDKHEKSDRFTGSIEIYKAFGILPDKFNKLNNVIKSFHSDILKSNLIIASRSADEEEQNLFFPTEEYMGKLFQKETEVLADMTSFINEELKQQFGDNVQMKISSPVSLKDGEINGLPDDEICFMLNKDTGRISIKSQERASFEEFIEYEALRENLGKGAFTNNYFSYRNRFILNPFCVKFKEESIKYIFPTIDLFSNGMGILRCSIPVENQSLNYIRENQMLEMISTVYLPKNLKEKNDKESKVDDAILRYLEKFSAVAKCNVLIDKSLTNVIIAKSDYRIKTFDEMNFEVKKDLLKLIYAPYNHGSTLDEDTKNFFDINVFGKDFLRILVSSTGHCISLCEESRTIFLEQELFSDEEKIKQRICSAACYIEQAVCVCLLNKLNLRKTYVLLQMSNKTIEILKFHRNDEDFITELYEGSSGSAIELIQFMRNKMKFFLNEDVYLRKLKNSEKNITQEKEDRINKIAARFNFITIIFTVFFGFPVIQKTIDIIKGQTLGGLINAFSFWIWIAVIIIVVWPIAKYRRK